MDSPWRNICKQITNETIPQGKCSILPVFSAPVTENHKFASNEKKNVVMLLG